MPVNKYPVVQLADSNANLIDPATGTGGGGSGSTGSVTAAGTNGTVAQAVQGINGGVPVPISGAVTASTAQRATIAEGGGTTNATAGTATQVIAADANRKKFEFQNLGAAVIVLRINVAADTTAAVTTTPTTKRMIAVPAGQLYVTEADVLCTGLVSVVSATASVPYSYLAS